MLLRLQDMRLDAFLQFGIILEPLCLGGEHGQRLLLQRMGIAKPRGKVILHVHVVVPRGSVAQHEFNSTVMPSVPTKAGS